MAANWWLSSQRKHFVKAPGELRAALGRAHGDLEPRELFDRKLSYTECKRSSAPFLRPRPRAAPASPAAQPRPTPSATLWRPRADSRAVILHVALGLGLRQRVSSTAIVYFRRFFLKNSFVDFSGPKVRARTRASVRTLPRPPPPPPLPPPLFRRGRLPLPSCSSPPCERNGLLGPRLTQGRTPAAGQIAATCLYVAAKTEESPVQAGQVQNQFNRTLASKPFAGDPFLPSAEVGRLGPNELLDLELVVLQQLDFYLVVFHPHRDAVRYVGDIGLEQAFLEDAWLMVNDTYRTDLCLLFPPYVIALGVLFALGHAKKQPDKIVSYLQEAGVDDAEVRHVCMELVNLYTKLGRGHPGVDVP